MARNSSGESERSNLFLFSWDFATRILCKVVLGNFLTDLFTRPQANVPSYDPPTRLARHYHFQLKILVW